MKDWKDCKNILCIRADNMGDVLMSSPAISALKSYTGAQITLLTSSKGAAAVRFIPAISEVMVCDLPWLKLDRQEEPGAILSLIEGIKEKEFDGCVIFTVYSQNPLPAAMLAYLAAVPLRLAYCRENPYALLSHWLPDEEPYQLIRHQVKRDLHLVAAVGAESADQRMQISLRPEAWKTAALKIKQRGADLNRPFLVLNPGVSEVKRRYPIEKWVALGRCLLKETPLQLLITGLEEEQEVCANLEKWMGRGAFSLAGILDTEEFASVIAHADVIVSVNTSTVHLASALGKPVVVLYAQSNPQHTPWMTPHRLLPFSIARQHKSKNQVITYVDDKLYQEERPVPDEQEILKALRSLCK